jgi:uncharacterized membrane protein YczE
MVNLTAIPNALMDMMVMEPTNEQIVTYTIGLVLPHLGTALYINPAVAKITKTK